MTISKKKNKKVNQSIPKNILHTEDLVERHIYNYYCEIRKKNERYHDHIEKTASWVSIKNQDSWKPYDFYNYFECKYRDKYGKEMRKRGSKAVIYNRIENFMKENGISNEDYKEFLDRCFSRYFNQIITPQLGNIVSPSLYDRMMGPASRRLTSEELLDIDEMVSKENDKFEEEIKDTGGVIYGVQ